MEALKIGRDDGVAVPNWVEQGMESRREGVGDAGEHAVKQFMNIKVKSSKEEVTVHAKSDLVSNWCSVLSLLFDGLYLMSVYTVEPSLLKLVGIWPVLITG